MVEDKVEAQKHKTENSLKHRSRTATAFQFEILHIKSQWKTEVEIFRAATEKIIGRKPIDRKVSWLLRNLT